MDKRNSISALTPHSHHLSNGSTISHMKASNYTPVLSESKIKTPIGIRLDSKVQRMDIDS